MLSFGQVLLYEGQEVTFLKYEDKRHKQAAVIIRSTGENKIVPSAALVVPAKKELILQEI